MVDELMRVSLSGGGDVVVEVSDTEPGVRRASRVGDTIQAVGETLDASLEPVREAAAAALEVFRRIGPDQVELEFGVKLNVSAGAIIAKTAAEGHLKVKLVWQAVRRDDPA
jgi:hypothetical protein